MRDQAPDHDVPAAYPMSLVGDDPASRRPNGTSKLASTAIPSPTAILVSCVLARCLGSRLMRRLKSADAPILICLQVPEKSWFDALRDAAKFMIRVPRLHSWDSSVRRSAGDPVVSEIVSQITAGGAVLCMSQDVATAVPRAVRTVADATVTLSAPEAADITLAISLVRGGRAPSRVPPDLGEGLELLEVAACLRPGDAPRVMVDRIRRAMAAKRSVGVDLTAPRLEDLHGYGAAAAWGRRVVADVAAYREGRITWDGVAPVAVLHGPPGTGKTLFARAMARSLGAPLFASSVSAWFASGASDLGLTIRTASAVFDGARTAVRECGVAVLFIDEIDSLPSRAALDANEGSWWRPVVNHILTQVDGATSDLRGIVLVAATNDLRAVDPALLRPGRFGTALEVLPPSVANLAGVVRHHLGGEECPLGTTEIAAVLRPLAGSTQARAAAWAREASRLARDAGRPVLLGDLVSVALPVDRRSAVERRRIAVHEAGHVVSAWHLAHDRFVCVSIVETGDTHGSTTMIVRDDALLVRDELETEVVIALSGRAADVVIGEGANAGAGGGSNRGKTSDLAIATRLLTAVHATYGLGVTLRHRELVEAQDDEEVSGLVEADLGRLMIRAETVISVHAAEVEAVAGALIERGFLDAADVGAAIATANTASGLRPSGDRA